MEFITIGGESGDLMGVFISKSKFRILGHRSICCISSIPSPSPNASLKWDVANAPYFLCLDGTFYYGAYSLREVQEQAGLGRAEANSAVELLLPLSYSFIPTPHGLSFLTCLLGSESCFSVGYPLGWLCPVQAHRHLQVGPAYRKPIGSQVLGSNQLT